MSQFPENLQNSETTKIFSAEIQPWATQASPKGAEQEKLLEEKLTPGKFSKEDENLKSVSAKIDKDQKSKP